jgi:hypothetical protein
LDTKQAIEHKAKKVVKRGANIDLESSSCFTITLESSSCFTMRPVLRERGHSAVFSSFSSVSFVTSPITGGE